jgi:hypothetical protein
MSCGMHFLREPITNYVAVQDYVGGITRDARCTSDIQYRVSMTKVAFNKEIISTSTFDYNLRRNY